MDTLAQMGWGQWFVAVLLVGVCFFLIIVILLQRGRGGGLAGAFGGAGGSSAFGAKTGDVFTWITVVTTAVFIVLAVVANFVLDKSPKPRRPTPASAAPVVPELPSADDVPPIKVTPIEAAPGQGETPADKPAAGEVPPSDAATQQGTDSGADKAAPPEGGDEEQPRP